MIKILLFFMIILAFAFSKDVYTFSINPLFGFFSALMGKQKDYVYNVILSSSFDHHSLDLKPSTVKNMKNSKKVFVVGTLEIEKEILKIIDKNKVFNLKEYIKLIDDDPHLWISVKNSKRIIELLYKEISTEFKVSNQLYDNYRKEYRKFVDLDKKFESFFKKNNSIVILSYHNEFRYFAKDYGVMIIPIFMHEEDISPKALKDITKKISLIHKNVFLIVPPYYDRKVVDYITKNANNLKVIVFNSNSINLYEEFRKLYVGIGGK